MHASILPSHRAASSRVSDNHRLELHRLRRVRRSYASSSSSFSASEATTTTGKTPSSSSSSTKEGIKLELIKLGAKTDRGQLLFPQKAYAPLDEYNRKHREEVKVLVELLTSYPVSTGNSNKIEKEQLNGEWECVLATKQIFRSSPFFMAIQDSFGDATFGDAKSSEVFFRLHDLQVMSWGASTVGRVAQRIDVEKKTLESDFDTILFKSTVIPILGWFKLLPTFGGRVVSFAENMDVDETTGRVDLELVKTRVERTEGIPEPPLFLPWFLDRDYPVNRVWKLLPWNKGKPPLATTYVKYVDEDFRVMMDRDGECFVYVKV